MQALYSLLVPDIAAKLRGDVAAIPQALAGLGAVIRAPEPQPPALLLQEQMTPEQIQQLGFGITPEMSQYHQAGLGEWLNRAGQMVQYSIPHNFGFTSNMSPAPSPVRTAIGQKLSEETGAVGKKQSEILYHGTNIPFRTSKEGEALWTTSDRARAQGFAENAVAVTGKGKARVLPVQFTGQQVLDATDQGTGEQQLAKLMAQSWADRQIETPDPTEVAQRIEEFRSEIRAGKAYNTLDWRQGGTSDVFDALRADGVQGLRVPDTIQGRQFGVGEAFVILDPQTIKIKK